ncbi:MAG: hypothetical protein KJ811_00365, partial [Candidatus Margulisbacteria bacterium]|nr:hypothetical protein [Candidatus Margulisiibacteriota bacterium]
MKVSREITRRTALAALFGAAGLALNKASHKLGISCTPSFIAPPREPRAAQVEYSPLVDAPESSLPELTLDQATGLIALHGLRITWATLRMFGACIVGQDDCIGGDIQSAIDDLQN